MYVCFVFYMLLNKHLWKERRNQVFQIFKFSGIYWTFHSCFCHFILYLITQLESLFWRWTSLKKNYLTKHTMKQVLKYTLNKDRTSNCVTIFHPIPYMYLSILSLSYIFDVHLCRKKMNQCGKNNFRRERDGVEREKERTKGEE